MESSITGNLPKNGQKVIDEADDLLVDATPAVTKAVSRAQSIGRQSIDAIGQMASQAQNAASNASDSIVAYTKKNPVTALTIAAASGALLYAAIKALTPARD